MPRGWSRLRSRWDDSSHGAALQRPKNEARQRPAKTRWVEREQLEALPVSERSLNYLLEPEASIALPANESLYIVVEAAPN
jgi:hypothetical protein